MEESSSIDLEIGIPHPLHRPRRKNQKQNRAFLPVKVMELLQRRHKVATWMLLVGASAVMVCSVYVFGSMFSALLTGPASRFALSLPQPRRLHHDYGRFSKLQNLVMVAGHSVYTSGSCENPEKEGSWFLSSHTRSTAPHRGQASTRGSFSQSMTMLFFCLAEERQGRMRVLAARHKAIGQLRSLLIGLVS